MIYGSHAAATAIGAIIMKALVRNIVRADLSVFTVGVSLYQSWVDFPQLATKHSG